MEKEIGGSGRETGITDILLIIRLKTITEFMVSRLRRSAIE